VVLAVVMWATRFLRCPSSSWFLWATRKSYPSESTATSYPQHASALFSSKNWCIESTSIG